MPRATTTRGPVCRSCDQPVKRSDGEATRGQWVHGNDNVFCTHDLLGMGLVAKFAEPK